jgi:hypothetical protein
MNRAIDTETLEAAARALISARVTNLGIEVTLPVLYPNGNAVNVVISQQAERYIVHDAGSGAMHLSSFGVPITKALRARLERAVAAYGCEFVSGRVSTTCSSDQIAVAMALVANASKAVGDEAQIAETLRISRFVERVAETLAEFLGDRVRNHEEIVADSGRTYRVGHVVLDATLDHPVAFVEAVPDKEAVPRRVAEFFDLLDQYTDVAREAVYDDSREWPSGHLMLLGKVSNPVPFTRWRSRAKALAKAA